MSKRMRYRRAGRLGVLTVAGAIVALTVFGGIGASSPNRATADVRVVTLPIANGFPLDLGIRKGFFQQQGIEIKKTTLQSGNDVVLALANNNGDIGYLGFVPMYIAVTSGIPMTLVAASEVEGTSAADNWQNILVKGSSSIRTPRDLAGKTIAVNALKGVGEVMIKAAMQKLGVSPTSFRLTALPFPQMRSALNNGQVDAIWTPEPFLSQAINIDGARSVMAPGPVLGRYWPIGGYAARQAWRSSNPALAQRFRTAINRSLSYAQAHPSEIRAMLPPGTQNVRLPIWSPLVDRSKLQRLAGYARKYDVITKLPNMRQLVPNSIASGLVLQGTVQARRVLLRLDGKSVTRLNAGPYTFVVTDGSRTQNFTLAGPGVNKRTALKGTGRSTWTLTLRAGTYRYWSSGRPRAKRSFRVA
ncbi:MAG TPA: ABC transporter substrate-binding protein [Gaiellaceae bacterium]|nr:ABC transporter substrate-binding protein [Gaiellaceae bacterium]